MRSFKFDFCESTRTSLLSTDTDKLVRKSVDKIWWPSDFPRSFWNSLSRLTSTIRLQVSLFGELLIFLNNEATNEVDIRMSVALKAWRKMTSVSKHREVKGMKGRLSKNKFHNFIETWSKEANCWTNASSLQAPSLFAKSDLESILIEFLFSMFLKSFINYYEPALK